MSEKKTWWEDIGGTPIDWNDPRLEGALEALKETQKEIVKAVRRREQLAAEYPVRAIVAPRIQEYKNAADSWYAQYMAWVKRGTEAELREIALTAELAAERSRRESAEQVADELLVANDTESYSVAIISAREYRAKYPPQRDDAEGGS